MTRKARNRYTKGPNTLNPYDEDDLSKKLKLDHIPEINIDDVLARAKSHQTWTDGHTTLKNMPMYENVAAPDSELDFPEEKLCQLWEIEIKRLQKEVQLPTCSSFNSGGLLGVVSPDQLDNLSTISDQIKCNLAIVYYDDCLLQESIEGSTSETDRTFMKYCHHLLSNRLSDECQDDENNRLEPPKILEHGNKELYFQLLDYVTAIIARTFLHSASGPRWNAAILAVLSKMTAKLKILCERTSEFASKSLDTAAQLEMEQENARSMGLTGMSPFKSLLSAFKTGTAESSNIAERKYHMTAMMYRNVIFSVINVTLDRAFLRQDAQLINRFSRELCTRVYRNGRKGMHTIIAEDEDGEFNSVTARPPLDWYRTALDMSLHNARAVSPQDDRQGPEATSQVLVRWRWDWDETQATRSSRPSHLRHAKECSSLRIVKMDDVVSVLVPFSLASPSAALVMSSTVRMHSALMSLLKVKESLSSFVQEDFSAEFSVSILGHKFHDDEQGGGPISTRGVCGLTYARQLFEHVLPGVSLVRRAGPSIDKPTLTPKQFADYCDRTDDWDIDETSIVVPCRKVVWPTLGVLAVCLIGAGTLPFLQVVQLDGVDPSNLTSCIWIACFFILLLIQSAYVPQWTWHDFIRARVRCRTLKEVVSITRVPAQVVIHKLLTSEKRTALRTRGPYNSMFLNRAAADESGFSINIPTTTVRFTHISQSR